ncbi:MAG: nucleoside deaminase [Dehalococcoidia bacterium]|nr:nucleoside deaminase [Dehalococcoidia bacterium]
MEESIEYLIAECYRVARQALQNGNEPFGALLTRKGQIVLTAENTVNTDGDLTRHAELNLVSRAVQSLPSDILSQCTLYASTEPCVMCAGAICWAGIPRVVYGCSTQALARLTGGVFAVPCREIFAGGRRVIDVIGPAAEEEGLQIHREFW